MEHEYGAHIEKLRIRPLYHEDIEALRVWRNNLEISKYFRKIPYITTERQNEWFLEYEQQVNCMYWVIELENNVIGSISLYNINDKKAEIGRFMIGDESARGKGYGYLAMLMTMEIGFEKLKLESIDLTVHENNIAAIKVYRKIGFHNIGSHRFDEGGSEYEMTITKKTYKEVNPMSDKIICYTENWGGNLM